MRWAGMKTRGASLIQAAVTMCVIVIFSASASGRVQTPSSSGPVAMIDEPVFRIPRTDSPPQIDGVMEPGEWEDASALSSFWYQRSGMGFAYLAAYETQLQVYAMYDDDYLYIAYVSPVYPEGSWLKTRGRFPNVCHGMYGVLRDDHIELEMRPYHDLARGFQLGLLKHIINPIDTVSSFYWSTQYGRCYKWDSGVIARSSVTDARWTLELAIPHEGLVYKLYDGLDEDGNEIVTLPPPDGTVYRCWFTRAISGTGPFFNAFDKHVWNTTKTRMIFDSDAVAFQINELGPILEDVIDLHLTVKNHSSRSETVRLGFFVESADGLIYSSYEDAELTDGMLELIPGEVRELRLRKPFPGITERGNVLWFDVRTAGTPAKPVFMTRLADFHSDGLPNFRKDYVDVIERLRPPRMDFDVRFDLCIYRNRIVAVIDRGIHGASEEAAAATEARASLVKAESGDEIATGFAPFHDEFAVVKLEDLPELDENSTYELSVLLFDEDRRIVGDYTSREFNKWKFPSWMVEKDTRGELTRRWIEGMNDPPTPVEEWKDNQVGLDDIVWEPYSAMEAREDGFSTLKHDFTLAESGLPEQIFIKPSSRMLPLELRGMDAGAIPAAQLRKVGRGPVLDGPMRLEALIGGTRYAGKPARKAELVRRWDSELEYRSTVEVGPIEAQVGVQYDCDGAFHVTIDYGTDSAQEVELFELVADFRAPVDLVASGIQGGGGMKGADVMECALPEYEGIIWDSTTVERPGLSYSHFVPWIFFGSGDWGLSWMAGSDRGWGLDRDGTSMRLERGSGGDVTWRVKFVNHPFDAEGRRSIDFTIMTHPAKPKPEDYRTIAWHYRSGWTSGYAHRPVDLSIEYLKDAYERWFSADIPPLRRGGRWRWWGESPAHRISPRGDRVFEQRGVYLLSRHVRYGGRHGWWWDESWPVWAMKSDDLAAGYAYERDPEDVIEGEEVPWQKGYTSGHMRSVHKRLARVMAESGVPQRQYHWANAQANMLEGSGWDAQLIEGAGNNHRGFDLDIMTLYPMSNFRRMALPFTGLIVRICGGTSPARPGDDRRLDRQQHIGIPLLHDMGSVPRGGCGAMQHVDEGLRAIDILDEFGYFDEEGTEFIPYWRSQHIVRWGEGRKRYAPRVDLHLHELDEELYVSVYRRAIEDENGRSGYKALLVLVNGFREDVTADITVLDAERVFGGPNILTRGEVTESYRSDYGRFADLLAGWTPDGNVPVLVDLEDGSMVELSSAGEGETYGSVHVRSHNYRLLYGHFLE